MAFAFGNFKFNEKQTVFQPWCICIKENYQPNLHIASPPTRRISKGTIEGTTCQMEWEPPLLSVSSGVVKFSAGKTSVVLDNIGTFLSTLLSRSVQMKRP